MGTRILVGTLLALALGAVLIADQWLGPWFPSLLTSIVLLGIFCGSELLRLLPAIFRPQRSIALGGVVLILLSNWYSVFHEEWLQQGLPSFFPSTESPWVPVFMAFTLTVIIAFLDEIARYREPGSAIPRLGLTIFSYAYLGVLPSFLVQLRWLSDDPGRSSLLIFASIAVPKFGDVGAYFTGTFLGRTRMTPLLSPKKTWEGATGGLIASILMAVGLNLAAPLFSRGLPEAIAFGVVVSVAGMLGDLAESLIKRDCHTKDASKTLPGFGGLLDLVDSVLFAAPVAYIWFVLSKWLS